MIDKFLAYMENQDWTVEVNDEQKFCLPEPMKSRYTSYAYYAISMKDGSVVYGAEPEFEECDTVADSFEYFMEKVISGRIQL